MLLPDLAAVTGRSRAIVAAAAGVLVAMLAANLAHTQFGLGGEVLEKALNAWGQNVVLACACLTVAVRVFNGGHRGHGRCWPRSRCGRSGTSGGASCSTT
jgi:hypothetical protein